MVDAETIIEQAEAEREEMQSLLRPVAEFFHSHEGELFERYEAVSKLTTAESVPSSDERTLHQVVGNLAADRVDPVQNVVRDSEKYVGVIDYHEHDYWYEYVEVDDVEGRMNVGICAQCVKDADNDAQVAKGIGTTEELAERIEDHYAEEHSESPESVETGATLVSGTTIAGNNAIHSANDGVGSGLDADTFRTIEGNSLVQPGKNYQISEESGVVDQFASPSSNPEGVGLDSSDCIWNSDTSADSIYELNQTGTVQSQFASPSSGSRGVGVDSTDSLWNVDYRGSGSIYNLDQTGTILSKFTTPSDIPYGLGVDSTDSLWHSEGRNSIYELNQSGTIQTQFESPDFSATGIGVDSNDSIWNADDQDTSIYNLDQTGTILSQFASPSANPKGVGLDSSDFIWNSDQISNSIYKIAQNVVTFQ